MDQILQIRQHLREFIQHDPSRRVVQQVQHVIHRLGQPANVTPLQGRDERRVQQRHDLVRVLIRLVLQPLDLVRVAARVLERLDEMREPFPGADDDLGFAVEQIEKPRVGGDKFEQRRLPLAEVGGCQGDRLLGSEP